MPQPLNTKYMFGENLLIAYLDLCGTKFVYSRFDLSQQIKRVYSFIKEVLENIENAFSDDKEYLYIHMYADSIVIAERSNTKIDKCADRLLELMLKIQYQLLLESEMLQIGETTSDVEKRPQYMPILSRALIRRGSYYGLVTSSETHIDNLFTNFSLVGGSAIVEMDNILRGLPMGVYIDNSIIDELTIDSDRHVDVSDKQLKFVKPVHDFDSLRQIFAPYNINYRGPESLDGWISQLIDSTGDNTEFKNMLIPWLDAVQGRRSIMSKRQIEKKE